jgi:hypothetical protein
MAVLGTSLAAAEIANHHGPAAILKRADATLPAIVKRTIGAPGGR